MNVHLSSLSVSIPSMEVYPRFGYCDRRFANTERWHLAPPKDADMRVPDTVKDCVVFIVEKKNSSPMQLAEFAGTGFIVAQPSEFGDTALFLYLVTAKHVLD